MALSLRIVQICDELTLLHSEKYRKGGVKVLGGNVVAESIVIVKTFLLTQHPQMRHCKSASRLK